MTHFHSDRSRVLNFLGWRPDATDRIRIQVERIMGPSWSYRPLTRVSDGYTTDARRGGSSNQVDGIYANVAAWLLYNDDLAWENAIIRARTLLDHVNIGPDSWFDTGHVQRWDSAIIVAVGIDDSALLSRWFIGYDRHSNCSYLLHGSPGDGTRPQFRAFGHAFSFAWFAERLLAIHQPVPAYVLPPDDFRNRAYAYAEALFNDSRWSNQAKVNEDPIYHWPYKPSSNINSYGASTVPFHHTHVVPSAMATAAHYGCEFKPHWMKKLRTMARWAWEMWASEGTLVIDGEGVDVVHTPKSKMKFYSPPQNAARGGRFRDWSLEDRESRGEWHYLTIPWFKMLTPSWLSVAEARHYLNQAKMAAPPGEVDACLVFEAIRRAKL